MASSGTTPFRVVVEEGVVDDDYVIEEKEEETISAFFVLFSFLLSVVIVLSKKLHDYPKIAKILPEAGVILLTGVLFGAILSFFVDETVDKNATAENNEIEETTNNNYYYDNNNNITDDELEILEVEEDPVAESLLLSFSPEIFFLVLLPPIIFNSGYHLRKELFFRHFVPICLFAVIGTAISAIVIALMLEFCYNPTRNNTTTNNNTFQPTFSELLTFGALLSATDPVTTLAVFQAKKVDPHLFYLVFGESVLNDAVGLILFNAFKDFVAHSTDAEEVAVDMSEFITGFLYDSVGSPALGILLGLIAAWLFKCIDMRSTGLLELSLFVLIMYVPFLLAEMLDLSGIVTILFSGLAAQVYVVPNLSTSTVENADVLFRLAAHLAETAIFLELGLSVFSLRGSIQMGFIGWTVLACLVARAANVYPITFYYNRHLNFRRRQRIPQMDDSSLELHETVENGGHDDDDDVSIQRQSRYDTSSRPSMARNGYSSPSPSPPRSQSQSQSQSPGPKTLELTNLPNGTYRESNNIPDNNDEDTQDNDDDASHEDKEEEEVQEPSSTEYTQQQSVMHESVSSFNIPQDRLDLKIKPNTAHMLWFSGLRGAVAYACVRSFPDTFGHADEFTMTTMIIVLVSVFGLGSTTECMLNILNIEMDVDENAYMKDYYREGPRGGWIVQWENYLYRCVVRGAGSGHVSVPNTDTPTSAAGTETPPRRIPSQTNNLETTTNDVEEFHDEIELDQSEEMDLEQFMQRRQSESVFDYGSRTLSHDNSERT